MPRSSAIARAAATGIVGCIRTPALSSISAAIVARRQGGARSTSCPSIRTFVVPIASTQAAATIASVRSIMSW